MTEFRVLKRLQSDGAVVIEPDGDLDLGGARLLASVLTHAVGRAFPHETVVEADHVRRVDDGAVRFLAGAWPRDPDGHPLCRVRSANDAVRLAFETGGAPDLLTTKAV